MKMLTMTIMTIIVIIIINDDNLLDVMKMK